MKSIISILALSLGVSLPAEAKQVCSAQTFTATCGSGDITLEVDNGNFYLNYGDVMCWHVNAEFSGKIGAAPDGYRPISLFSDGVYSLDAKKHLSFGSGRDVDFSIGTLEIEKQKGLARISIDKSRVVAARDQTYYLQCKEVATQL